MNWSVNPFNGVVDGVVGGLRRVVSVVTEAGRGRSDMTYLEVPTHHVTPCLVKRSQLTSSLRFFLQRRSTRFNNDSTKDDKQVTNYS